MSSAPTHLLQEIKNNLNDFNADPINSGSARTRALEAAKKLVIALENPAETILQHAFSVRALVPAIVTISSVDPLLT